jgi:zinc D-Ala-D-Ala carboxypeptidase
MEVLAAGMEGFTVTGKLGKFFTDEEFLRSNTAKSAGIINTWDNEGHRENAIALVAMVLDPLREKLGKPISVTSGYRSGPLLDEMVRRDGTGNVSRTSDHRYGKSADIKVRGMTSEALADAVRKSGVPYDQLIWYHPSRGGHVHVSYRSPHDNRGMTGYAWSKAERKAKKYADWDRRPFDGVTYA